MDAADDTLGWSIALSGDGSGVLCGAPPMFANSINAQMGDAVVFHWVHNPLSRHRQELQGDGTTSRSDFGLTVTMSTDGRVVAVSVIANGGFGDSFGSVRIFKLQ